MNTIVQPDDYSRLPDINHEKTVSWNSLFGTLEPDCPPRRSRHGCRVDYTSIEPAKVLITMYTILRHAKVWPLFKKKFPEEYTVFVAERRFIEENYSKDKLVDKTGFPLDEQEDE